MCRSKTFEITSKPVFKTIYLSILLSSNLVFAFSNYDPELYAKGTLSEGGACTMEDGTGSGTCVELIKCPMRIEQVKAGKRFSTSTGRCGFKGSTEIVCCPNESHSEGRNNNYDSEKDKYTKKVDENLGLRPATIACNEYESGITGQDGYKVSTNIINGERAAFGEFPYTVALGYPSDDEKTNFPKYNCGGTLISTKHVLTAAHCVSNINNFVPTEVRLGSTNLQDNSKDVQRVPIAKIISHPQYKRSLNYYDIAILRLARKIKISKTVMPICLQNQPIPNLSQLANLSLIVTGWGVTDFENDGSNDLQKSRSLKMIDQTECNKLYKGLSSRLPRGIDDSMICMLDTNSTNRSDACQGDSGGPLLRLSAVSQTVLGVVSFGQSCGSPTPAVYTSVFHYIDWIEEVVWPDKKRAL